VFYRTNFISEKRIRKKDMFYKYVFKATNSMYMVALKIIYLKLRSTVIK